MNKPNKKKEKMADSVAEAIVEIILTIVFAGIGFLICLCIGKIFRLKMDNFDIEWFALIGIVVLAVIVLVISVVKTIINKLKDKNKRFIDDQNKSHIKQ